MLEVKRFGLLKKIIAPPLKEESVLIRQRAGRPT